MRFRRCRWCGEGSCALSLEYVRLQRLFTTVAGRDADSFYLKIISLTPYSLSSRIISDIPELRGILIPQLATRGQSRTPWDTPSWLGRPQVMYASYYASACSVGIKIVKETLESAPGPVGDKRPHAWFCHTTRLFEKRIAGAL
jgi:hypothetical protein